MEIGRNELVAYLDDLFEIALWETADSSLNGLQVEGAARVEKIAFAVDSCDQTFRMAAAENAQMLITHHGLFWGKPLAITGHHLRRVRSLLEAGLSLYAAHLPLDFHPRIGHNAVIARRLELETEGPLVEQSGLPVGTLATAPDPVPLDEFVSRLDSQLSTSSRLLAFGPAQVRRVGIIAGDGGKLLDERLAGQIDTFLTGEESHTVYHFAREFGVNVIFAGHYATEVPGLVELAAHLEDRFSLPTVFLSAPTGL